MIKVVGLDLRVGPFSFCRYPHGYMLLTAIQNFDDIFDFIYHWVRKHEQQSNGFIVKFLDKRKWLKDFTLRLFIQPLEDSVTEILDEDDAYGVGVRGNPLTGWKRVTFFDHLISPQKKNRYLYQPRRFTFTKIKNPSGSVSQTKPKLNVLADSDGSQRTWYNQKK